ncbi:DNA translocase FtsK 4TM domain-containing protein [Magnetospirillum sp. SS-4]|uniref:FtsK/SpoIIIE family DNA translocase n=1 Tax=Magnetospirillum sp. SS-4 TaxID=2681465 RepID=UPI00137D8A2E|nr:DNA translocase FtsK 4TM domain-containing protein [Magnetospirillum sp. SS-4]CAA7614438.1 DNA translocase FtsK [Magnetospirillum sp. SS-4]
MAVPSRKARLSSGFLPRGTAEFLRRRLIQSGGLALLALGLAMLAALVTADPHDPSFNTAADGLVVNVMGRPGAYLADFLYQAVGWGAVLPAAAALVWGVLVLVHVRLPIGWPWRLALLAPSMVVWALALAALPVPEAAVLPAGPGGALGHLLNAGLALILPPEITWIAGPAAVVLALAGTVYVIGLSGGDWATLGRRSLDMAVATGHAATALRRPPAADDAPPPRRTEPAFHSPSRRDDGDEDDDDEVFVPPPPSSADDDAPLQGYPQGSLVQPKRPPAPPGKRERAARQGTLDLGAPPSASGYELPPLSLLAHTPDQTGIRMSQDSLTQNARMLESVLEDFGVNGKIVKVRPGPVVTLYELEPAPGTKTSRVIGLADDIARSMSALSVRIATVPGRSVIGIEMPNSRREVVFLRELLAAEQFEKASAKLTLVLGKDIGGAPVMVDLARMPHLLIAGTTGSGKSVAINTMILSLLYRLTPEECRIIMIDPKMLELSVYDGIPHLLAPVVTEPGKAVVALKWAVREMEDRYRAMSQLGVRNIAGYNHRLGEARTRGEVLTRTVQTGFDPETGKPTYEDQILALEPLPFIVVIVDEMADLMLVAGKDIEAAVQRLAQMARAAGIHILMATQRPSVDVITGTIKANFPTRISFQVTSKIDSRTILGEQGAEQLLGQGDMLYMASGGRITRVHGPFVSDEEVEKVVEHLRSQGEPSYIEAVTEDEEAEFGPAGGGGGDGGEDIYDQAVAVVIREGKVSTSFVQRQLQIGYNRAARLVERMEAEGVISRPNHAGKREILARGGKEEY